MRSPTFFRQSGFEKKPITPMILLIIGVFLLLLSGCAEESVDEAADCQVQLDNSNFQVVADNTSCSDYERGSAELSLAGFIFANFMTEEANSNFPSVFNLTATGCTTSDTDSLVGDYDSAYQQNFLRAQYWSRTKAEADSTTRSNATIEISYFSTLGEIIVQTYCQIDANLDGTISVTENQAFTQINIGSSAVGSSTLDSSSGYYQFVYSGAPWLCDSGGSDTCRKDLTYEGVWANADSGTTMSYATLLADDSNISAISIIVTVEELQQLFSSSATAADITKPYDFLSMYTNRANLLLTDLTALGISESDDIYENVSESVGQLDNGGTCTSDSAQVLDLLTNIVANGAPDESAATLPSTNYETYNLLATSEIPQLDTTESEATSPCGSCPTMKSRLIYKQGATYTGLYKTADTGIDDTLTNLATLTLDSSDNLIDIVAGDETIALKELLCSSSD